MLSQHALGNLIALAPYVPIGCPSVVITFNLPPSLPSSFPLSLTSSLFPICLKDCILMSSGPAHNEKNVLMVSMGNVEDFTMKNVKINPRWAESHHIKVIRHQCAV